MLKSELAILLERYSFRKGPFRSLFDSSSAEINAMITLYKSPLVTALKDNDALPSSVTDALLNIVKASNKPNKLTAEIIYCLRWAIEQPTTLEIKHFMQAVVEARYDDVRTALLRHSKLLLSSVVITDNAGRTLKTTAWNYATWALDTVMQAEIKKILESVPFDIAQILTISLQQQTQEFAKNSLIDVVSHSDYGAQFNFEPLLAAYNAFMAYENKLVQLTEISGFTKQAELKRLWLAIGKLQRTLPMHILRMSLTENNNIGVDCALLGFAKTSLKPVVFQQACGDGAVLDDYEMLKTFFANRQTGVVRDEEQSSLATFYKA